LGAFLCFTQPAGAAIVSFDLNFEFSGAQTPAGSPPWGTATFDDEGTPGTVTLTMTSNINQTPQTGEWFEKWYFNYDPELPGGLTTAAFSSSDTNKGGLTIQENFLRADGDGYFDFFFDWPNPAGGPPSDPNEPKAFYANGDTVTYIITKGGLTADDFDYLSVTTEDGDDTTGGLPHAGRIQGLPRFDGPNEGSGWLTEQTMAPIPVPGSALLLAPGLILLVAVRRKFKS
jgi:hypothetical protein